jgi:hypothetical protein
MPSSTDQARDLFLLETICERKSFIFDPKGFFVVFLWVK